MEEKWPVRHPKYALAEADGNAPRLVADRRFLPSGPLSPSLAQARTEGRMAGLKKPDASVETKPFLPVEVAMHRTTVVLQLGVTMRGKRSAQSL